MHNCCHDMMFPEDLGHIPGNHPNILPQYHPHCPPAPPMPSVPHCGIDPHCIGGLEDLHDMLIKVYNYARNLDEYVHRELHLEDKLDLKSIYPVKNKVIAKAIADIHKTIENLENARLQVDSCLSDKSKNPVQNKVINHAIDCINDSIDALGDAVAALKNNISNISNRLISVENDIATLKSNGGGSNNGGNVTCNCNCGNGGSSGSNVDLSSVNSRLSALERDVNSLKQRVAALEANPSNPGTNPGTGGPSVDEILDQLRGELDELYAEMIANAHRDLTEQINTARKLLQDAKELLANLDESTGDSGLEQKLAKLEAFANWYDVNGQTVTNLKTEWDAIKGTITTTANRVDVLNNTVTQIGSQMDTINGKFTNYVAKTDFNNAVAERVQEEITSGSWSITASRIRDFDGAAQAAVGKISVTPDMISAVLADEKSGLGAAIILAINGGKGSSATIDADKVNITGEMIVRSIKTNGLNINDLIVFNADGSGHIGTNYSGIHWGASGIESISMSRSASGNRSASISYEGIEVTDPQGYIFRVKPNSTPGSSSIEMLGFSAVRGCTEIYSGSGASVKTAGSTVEISGQLVVNGKTITFSDNGDATTNKVNGVKIGTQSHAIGSDGWISIPEYNKGTVTAVKVNGSTKTPNSSGVIDLGNLSTGGTTVNGVKLGNVEYSISNGWINLPAYPTSTGGGGITGTYSNGILNLNV